MSKKKKGFEESVNRLTEIISIIENPETTLSDSIELYKEGMDLSGFCMKELVEAEKEVVTLSKDFEGKFVTENYET